MNNNEMAYREFTVRGRVYSGNESHAKHGVYWAIANSDEAERFLIDEVTVEGETK